MYRYIILLKTYQVLLTKHEFPDDDGYRGIVIFPIHQYNSKI